MHVHAEIRRLYSGKMPFRGKNGMAELAQRPDKKNGQPRYYEAGRKALANQRALPQHLAHRRNLFRSETVNRISHRRLYRLKADSEQSDHDRARTGQRKDPPRQRRMIM